jgi:hypothetical protein
MLLYGVILDRRDPFSYRRLSKLAKEALYKEARAEVRLIESEAVIEELEHGTTLLVQFIRQRGWNPPWLPTRVAHLMNGGALLLPLYELLYDRFSDDELADLSFRIAAGPDALEGETHSARARCLVEYVKRHGLVDEILRAGREVRPELVWPEIHD